MSTKNADKHCANCNRILPSYLGVEGVDWFGCKRCGRCWACCGCATPAQQGTRAQQGTLADLPGWDEIRGGVVDKRE